MSLTGSSSNSWFKLIGYHQRRKIKLIQAVFYCTCLETSILILNNHFLLFPLWARPLLVLTLCWFLVQGCELTSSLLSCVWEPELLAYPECACLTPPFWSIHQKAPGEWAAWHEVNLELAGTFGDWLHFIWVARELSKRMDLDTETHLRSEKDRRVD